MELIYVKSVAGSGYDKQILKLLALSDKEFVPPLSARVSSTQQTLDSCETAPSGVVDYYGTMACQPAILAVEAGKCLGFMAFKVDYTCEYVQKTPNLYASTCIVHPDARGRHLMQGFYEKMLALFPGYSIFTRTWHTNLSHLRVLEKLGFTQCARLKDHRGPGMDTVYYSKVIDNG